MTAEYFPTEILGSLNVIVWKSKPPEDRNKIRNVESFCKINYVVYMRGRPATLKTRRLLEPAEMKVLCEIAGKTLHDRERN